MQNNNSEIKRKIMGKIEMWWLYYTYAYINCYAFSDNFFFSLLSGHEINYINPHQEIKR